MLTVHRRLAKPRGFDYTPRFHDPKEDERKRRHIRIDRVHRTRNRKTRQPMFITIGLGLVLAFYLYANADAVFGGAVTALSNIFGG